MKSLNGNYQILYKTLNNHIGNAEISLLDGIITGNDYTGAEWCGNCRIDGEIATANVSFELTGAPGTYSAITGDTGKLKHTLEFSFPKTFSGSHTGLAKTVKGNIEVTIIKE